MKNIKSLEAQDGVVVISSSVLWCVVVNQLLRLKNGARERKQSACVRTNTILQSWKNLEKEV